MPTLTAVVAASLLPALPLTAADAATPSYLSGPDVSHWQHAADCTVGGVKNQPCPIDWAAVKAAGQSFAISKATESTNFTDPYFASDYAAERANGLVRGAYHYARPQLPISTAVAQADYFAGVIGNVQEAGDLPPIMDFEESGGLGPADLITWGQTFLAELMAKTGRTPMIYTYRNFWRTALLNSTAFTRYPLWIADYTAGATTPTPPLIGGWPTWALWQWTSTDSLSGIHGIVDDSHFNGSAAALAAFADGTHPSVLTPTRPSAPLAVQAGPAGNALKVTWLPGDNGGSLVTSYTVTVQPGNEKVIVPGSATSAVVPGLSTSVLYTATVAATNAVGTGPSSTSSSPIGATNGIVPVSLTLSAKASSKATPATSGRTTSLVGALVRTDGLGTVAGAPLVVYAKETGSSGYTATTSVITSSTGTFSVPVTPGVTTRYMVQYAGGAGWSPAVNNVLVYSRVKVTTALNHTSVKRNTTVTLRGQVSVAAAGLTVFRQRWYSNAWHSGPGAKVTKDGRYSFAVKPTVKGKTKLRVILGSKPQLVGSYSPTVVLSVR